MSNGFARGRPEVSLVGRKYGFLLPLKRERLDGITYWHCACIGCNGYFDTPGMRCVTFNEAGERLVRVQHSQLISGNKRSCGCQRFARSGSTQSVLPKKEKPYCVPAKKDDYAKAKVPPTLLMGLPELAHLFVDRSATTAPQGEVLSGEFVLLARDGSSIPCSEADNDRIAALLDDGKVDEYYEEVEKLRASTN